MKIARVPMVRINAAFWNPRKDLRPGDPEFEAIKRSVDQFGLVEPLVWNERSGNLVGGHQRFKVLLAAGHTEVEVSVVDLPPEREKALGLALNKISGAWDEVKLESLLAELVALPDFDVEMTGFVTAEIGELVARLDAEALRDKDDDFDPAEVLVDDAPAVTQRGEIITLGGHRLMCGDASSSADVKKLMGDSIAQVVVTDPPYATDAGGNEPAAAGRNRVRRIGKMPWDQLSAKKYAELISAALQNAHEVSDGSAALYLWFAARRIREVHLALTAANYRERSLIVWAKDRLASFLHGNYKYQYELCYYAHKKGQSPRWLGPSNASNLWQCDRAPRIDGHPTVKPVELIETAISNSSSPGDNVLDLFVGSGTAFIAAARTGRHCFGMDIEPLYCDVAVRRFIAFVGKDHVAPEVASRYSQTREDRQ